MRRFVTAATMALFLSASACGGPDTGAMKDGPAKAGNATSLSDSTVELFADLPRAESAPPDAFGDLYFNLLTRVTAEVDALQETGDVGAAREAIAYARAEVAILKDRVGALPDEARSAVFQDGVAQLSFARTQYKRAVRRIDPNASAALRDFAEDADERWPSLRW